MKTVLIIPTYNERKNLEKLIPTIERVFEDIPAKFDMNILIVDDKSPDGTAELVKKLQKNNKFLHLFVNQKKAGLGNAYLKGMAYAIDECQAEILMQMDADFSHDPNKIPQLLSQIDRGNDLVLGSRYTRGGSIPADWGLHRKILSFTGNFIVKAIMGNFKIHDWTGGFRAHRKEVFNSLRKELNSERFFGYTFQIAFLHKASRKGFKITEVPIHFTDRTIGESKLGVEYIKNALLYVIRARVGEILRSDFPRFAFVGFVGFVVNVTFLHFFSYLKTPEWFAWAMSTELAIISNFLLNNYWTFKGKTIKGKRGLIKKFTQFNLSSSVALAIQTLTGVIGVRLLGPKYRTIILIFTIGFLVLPINWLVYNKIIWKKGDD